MKNRSKIISESSLSLEVDWIFDVRTLINDTISLIEITLNEIYIKAEYSPLTHWKPFDKLKLGDRHGRRFNDKLRWVFTITGKHIEAEKYLPSINNLRELRNHLMHFDPPSFAYSFEEVTIWLNQIIDVGYLLIKIRQAIGVNISIDLLNFILQKEAIFNPEPQYIKRLPFIDGKGDYASSTW